MLGLGETREELGEVIDQLGELGLTILTLGQYLQPSKKHLEVTRYVHPDEFAELKQYALARGVLHVESGPLVRSSYHAEGQAQLIRRLQHSHGRVGFASLAR
jgi:lipoic acid synthetase